MAPDETPDTSSDMWLTLHEAARAFDVSLATLHRRRKAGELEAVGAFKDKGSWKIPRQGLARLGFQEIVPPVTPGQTTIEDALRGSESVTTPMPLRPSETVSEAREAAREVQRLKDELNAALRRAEVAEAVSRERDRVIEVQARELARLEAGPSRTSLSDTPPVIAPETPSEGPLKRSRWRRWLSA